MPCYFGLVAGTGKSLDLGPQVITLNGLLKKSATSRRYTSSICCGYTEAVTTTTDGDVLQVRPSLEVFDKLEPIQFRHGDIGEHNLRKFSLDQFQPLGAVPRHISRAA